MIGCVHPQCFHSQIVPVVSDIHGTSKVEKMIQQNDPALFPQLQFPVLRLRANMFAERNTVIKEIFLHPIFDSKEKYGLVLVIHPLDSFEWLQCKKKYEKKELPDGCPDYDTWIETDISTQARSKLIIQDLYQVAPEGFNFQQGWDVFILLPTEDLPTVIVKNHYWQLYPDAPTPKKANGKIESFPKPQGINWEDITIKFFDGHSISISFADPNHRPKRIHYSQMGFADRRNGEPNSQWNLLQRLAENGGRMSWDSPGAMVKNKKRKQKLADTLKSFFQLQDDPFYKYNPSQGYVTRFKIIQED